MTNAALAGDNDGLVTSDQDRQGFTDAALARPTCTTRDIARTARGVDAFHTLLRAVFRSIRRVQQLCGYLEFSPAREIHAKVVEIRLKLPERLARVR